MFPDPITPRSYPDLLQRVDYDPFGVLPDRMPAHPRVFATAGHLSRAKARVAAGEPIDTHCFRQLIESCELDRPLPTLKTADGPPDWGGPLVPWLNLAFRNALAFHLTGDGRHRARALEAMRLAAMATSKVARWTGHEHHEAGAAGRAYDLLAADGLTPDDDNRFREMLWTLVAAMDRCEHRHCNNHNAMQMAGRIALAAALGSREQIHHVFYGCQQPAGWRYGLIHLLRHDFLADGSHWEGTMGYHKLVLMMVCECFTVMDHLGVSLWSRPWPALNQDDGFDEHRGHGPKGIKPLTAAFDAMLYEMFTNGDYSLLHDEVLGNLRGSGAWWRLFNKAFDVYGHARYAWALNHINHGRPITRGGGVPAWFADGHGATEFVRLETRDVPEGEHPLLRDAETSLLGKHESGCTNLPCHGSTILRASVTDAEAPGVSLYWGPHWAGHRSPAALHLDLHALGRRVAVSPHLPKEGYGSAVYLTWFRSTIAHNTVTLDETPMFPYDFETQSIWECDRWRDTISDGRLESFQPGGDFKAMRASNDNVYAGALLDRAVVLADGFVLDVFRVRSDRRRRMDWAMHCHGEFVRPLEVVPVELGGARGYRHLSDAAALPQASGWVDLPFRLAGSAMSARLWLDGAVGSRVVLARDPEVDARRPLGDAHAPEDRTCVMVRAEAECAAFVSMWTLTPGESSARVISGDASSDLEIETTRAGRTRRWRFPRAGAVAALGAG